MLFFRLISYVLTILCNYEACVDKYHCPLNRVTSSIKSHKRNSNMNLVYQCRYHQLLNVSLLHIGSFVFLFVSGFFIMTT